MAAEEQAADHADGIHRIHDRDHQVRDAVALLVEHVQRRRHRREAHVEQKRDRRHPEADAVVSA